MENMLNSLPHMILGVGLILLIIELLLGFTTIVLLTLGLSCLITSGLMYAGFLDEELLHAFLSVAILDTILMVVLWRPMKNLQTDRAPNEVKSDWIGTTFDLDEAVAPGQPGSTKFSGVTWKVKASTPIAAGETVCITKVEVGILHVEKAG
ncbi:NfeD family protein [Alteromonas sp. CYL-A6]|uniref:NfeD family protein n=1 Tax=Alteromonas nitratireducens TaxID=3390813 RepID=UPI0034C24A7C